MARCTNCEQIVINGEVCHEIGCPDSKLDYFTGMYNHTCKECGCQVQSDDRYLYTCCEEDSE